MKNCPDYFKAPNGEIYPCCGTDEGYYWAENPENSFELWKFEQGECQPLSEEELKKQEYFNSLYGENTVSKLSREDEPHEVSQVKCYLCNHSWVAVRPAGLEKLECPNCGNMVHFENLYSKVDYMSKVELFLKSKNLAGVDAHVYTEREGDAVWTLPQLLREFERLLQQTPCSTLRDSLVQKLSKAKEMRDQNYGDLKRLWQVEVTTLTEVITMIDERQPVA